MTTHWRPENHKNLSSRYSGWKSKAKADKAVCTLKVLGRVLSCHFPARAWCSLACGSIAPISCHLPVCLHVVLSPCVSVCFASSSKDAGHRIWGSSSTRMTSVDLMTSTKTLFSNKVAPTDIGIRSSTLGGGGRDATPPTSCMNWQFLPRVGFAAGRDGTETRAWTAVSHLPQCLGFTEPAYSENVWHVRSLIV